MADEPVKLVIDCAASAQALPEGAAEEMGREAQQLWWAAQQDRGAAEAEADEAKAEQLRVKADAKLAGAEELAGRIRADEELKASGRIAQQVPLTAEEIAERDELAALAVAQQEAEEAAAAEREEMAVLADKIEAGQASDEEVQRALAFALRR
jgi:hypothetical protein